MTRESAKAITLASLRCPAPTCPSDMKMTRMEKLRRFVADIKCWTSNIRAWPTAWAYRTLKRSLQKDPSYAHAWHCNIAMPIYDAAHGEVSAAEANRYATVLMNHLFSVKTSTNPYEH